MDALRSRTPLVPDVESGVLRSGAHEAPISEGDPLASYLSLVYRARGVERGTRLPLRDEDLDVLAALVGDDPDEVEARLVELMDCTPDEARSLRALLLGRRTVATAAGVALVIATLVGLSGGDAPSAPAGALAAAPMEVVAPAPAAPTPPPAPFVLAPVPVATTAVEAAPPAVQVLPTAEVLAARPSPLPAPAERSRRSEAPAVVRLVPVDEVLAPPPPDVSSDVIEREVEPLPPQPAPIPLRELPTELVLPDLPAPAPLPIVGDGPVPVDELPPVLPGSPELPAPDLPGGDPTGELPSGDLPVPPLEVLGQG